MVHSFDGDEAEMRELIDLGLEIGLNGCSLKTEDNLAVAAQVPLHALHTEISPLYLAYISHIAPYISLYLPGAPGRAAHRDGRAVVRRQAHARGARAHAAPRVARGEEARQVGGGPRGQGPVRA